MNKVFLFLTALTLAMKPTFGHADNLATTRVPMCLQFPDSNKFVPCTGVVPVDAATGNALNWGTVFKGSTAEPVYTQETTRRTHWTETTSPLPSNGSFTGSSHDDGASVAGGSTRSTSFSCFAIADQEATLSIQGSDDNSTWINFQSRTMTASVGMYLIQPLFTRYWRCKVVNGTSTQTMLHVKSAFGM